MAGHGTGVLVASRRYPAGAEVGGGDAGPGVDDDALPREHFLRDDTGRVAILLRE